MKNQTQKKIFDGKKEVLANVDNISDDLINIANYILNNPELAGEEHKALKQITDLLKKYGFNVKKGISGVATSFIATLNCEEKGPSVAFLCEYEALPKIGHGAGHNLTSSISVGSAIALSLMHKKLKGKIICIGTPGESKFNSKLLMLNNGIFNDIDIVMIAKAGDRHNVNPIFLANKGIQFSFKGKPSHAAAAPDKGINALDSVIALFNSINALRQQLKEDARIHGVVVKGGEAVNIIPDVATARYYIRAKTREYLCEIEEKVKNCARGAALQTGAKLKISYFEKFADSYLGNNILSKEYSENLISLHEVLDSVPKIFGSSDIGNISYLIPTLCPVVKIAPLGVELHTLDMTKATCSKIGLDGLIVGAKSLAMTALRAMMDPEFLNSIKENHQNIKKNITTC